MTRPATFTRDWLDSQADMLPILAPIADDSTRALDLAIVSAQSESEHSQKMIWLAEITLIASQTFLMAGIIWLIFHH